MSQVTKCPICSGTKFNKWLGGKKKCVGCDSVFSDWELIREKYVPTSKRPPRIRAAVQEKADAKALGGVRTIASGQTARDKADVKGDDFRLEVKYTAKASYSLKRAALELIIAQATGDQMPLFSIEFQNPGQAKAEWFIVPKEWFLELLEAHRQVTRGD